MMDVAHQHPYELHTVGDRRDAAVARISPHCEIWQHLQHLRVPESKETQTDDVGASRTALFGSSHVCALGTKRVGQASF